MTMAAATYKEGIVLGRFSTAHLLPRPKEWKETIILKKKTEKGKKKGKIDKSQSQSPPIFSGKRPFIWVPTAQPIMQRLGRF